MNKTEKKHKTKDTAGLRDKLIGKRIRQQRQMLGMTQTELASRLALTFQQIQKYEMGFNKLSAARLLDISQELETPIEFFYESFAPQKRRPVAMSPAVQGGFVLDKESATLLRNYFKIEDKGLRKSVYGMVKKLAALR